MKTIWFNNKLIPVPSDTIIDYLEFRKLSNEINEYYSEGFWQTEEQLIQNIMLWANDYAGLMTTFPELQPELEKLAINLI